MAICKKNFYFAHFAVFLLCFFKNLIFFEILYIYDKMKKYYIYLKILLFCDNISINENKKFFKKL